MPDFRLSAVLEGHTSDVRAVALPDPSLALTASRDGTTRLWKQTSTSPPTYDATESSHGAMFKTCLAYAPEAKGYPEGLIFSGGQDSLIEARQPGTTSERDADGLMIGHAHQVCSLDVNVEAGYVVSGSWDRTAKIWQLGRWEPEVELQGHEGSVWAVVAYSGDTIVTGCADHGIRVFDIRGKQQIAFDGRDVVRALAKLPKGHKSGGELVSATNDFVIRIWTLNGKELKELIGHESYIYSLAVLPSGDIVSSGEDRTVRVWDGPACLQVITLPAISVWSVAACPNGDIITGSSDKVARIFTKDEKRLADPALIAQFDEQIQASVIPEQQMGEINKIDAPGPEFLERKSGTKEGQTQTIKEADGSIWLYSWSSSQRWTKVGQVVGAAPGSGSKKMYNGKEYDYVFDVDIAEGKPPLKLPYNTTQNPHEAAMKFLQDNELPMSYLDETANFIVKSTQGASLGSSSHAEPQPPGADPWGTESRYRPGVASTYQPPPPAPSSRKLPHKDYLSIITGKPDASYRQILKLNAQYAASSDSQWALSEAELDTLSTVVKQLENYTFGTQATLESTPAFDASVPIVIKVATQWQPPQNRLAGLDLLRFLAAAVKGYPDVEVNGENLVVLIANSGIFEKDILASNLKLPMIAVRFFSNLVYGSDLGRDLLEAEYELLLSKVKLVTPMAVGDVALAVAVTTFYLNLAVYCTSKPMLNRTETLDRGLTVVEELQKILSSFPTVDSKLTGTPLQQATEPVFRAVVGLGTILTGLKDEQIIMAAKDILGVPGMLNQLRSKGLVKEPRFHGLVSEIMAALA